MTSLNVIYVYNEASVAKWLDYTPFTSEVTGSVLTKDLLMRVEPSPNVKRGAWPGAPISPHRGGRQGG